MNRLAIMGSVAAIVAAVSMPANAQFRTALQESRTTADEAKASQTRINQLDDQTNELLNQFRADTRQYQASLRYNRSLQRTIEGQERVVGRLQDDIANVAGLQQAVEPLMGDMVSAFERMVDADMPFNLEGDAGRLARAQRLRTVLDDPNQSAAQKYRLIIEAYELENEFGRTINPFEGSITVDGNEISGEFLQIGRVMLIFKTKDDAVLKAWDNKDKAWYDLNSSYIRDVNAAMQIAKEQAAPKLFALPIKVLSAAE